MKNLILGVGCCALLLLFLPQGTASAQTVVPNGDLELQALGEWELTGDNDWQKMKEYDTNGDGSLSWCWKRKPGKDVGQPFGNGGFAQDVYLVAGVAYEFNADVAYLATC